MKALLTNNYISTLHSSKEYKEFIENNKGKFVEIDTNNLFDNQYNTKCGFRIYDTNIDKMVNDIRTDKNIFFVENPNGKDTIKKVDFNDHLKNKRFLSCYDVNGNYYRISRRTTIHFILVGEKIYIDCGIGYTPLKKAKLTHNEKEIVKYCANRILTDKI